MTHEEIANSIICNNYAVVGVFDDMIETLVSEKYLTKKRAEDIFKTKRNRYLTSYRVVKRLAIVGIVSFNEELAYIFNEDFTKSSTDNKTVIASNTYENLMDCCVFHYQYINEKLLKELVEEYYERGGIVYENYQDFEILILKKEANVRRKKYRDDIVFNSIFKHDFREVGKNKWSNGSTVIKQGDIQRSSIKYPYCKSHCELETSLDNRILIGSIFGRYYEHINQISNNTFGIVCKNNKSYNFTYFEITINKQ